MKTVAFLHTACLVTSAQAPSDCPDVGADAGRGAFLEYDLLVLDDESVKKVTVSDKGQVALPVSILRKTGIRPGDRLLVSEGNRIVLARGKRGKRLSADEFWAMMDSIWAVTAKRGRPSMVEKLLRDRRRDIRKETRRL